jgi:hypothetical protein
MRAKPAILLAGAVTLISVGVFLRREPESAIVRRGALGRAPDFPIETQAVWGSTELAPPIFAPSPVAREHDLESVRQLAESDPSAAAHLAPWLPASVARIDAIKAVAIAWANRDLPGAVEWGRRLPDENERETALMCIGFEAARSEPLTALTLAIELNVNSERDELIRHAVGEWAVTAPDAAAGWARQIEDRPLRGRTLAAIAIAWAEIDPRVAATVATEELEPGRLQEDTVVSVAQRWAQREPAEAVAWINSFEEGELRAAALAACQEQVVISDE